MVLIALARFMDLTIVLVCLQTMATATLNPGRPFVFVFYNGGGAATTSSRDSRGM